MKINIIYNRDCLDGLKDLETGTTAISARILSRKFIGFERDEGYFKIAEGRIKEHIIQRKLFEVVE